MLWGGRGEGCLFQYPLLRRHLRHHALTLNPHRHPFILTLTPFPLPLTLPAPQIALTPICRNLGTAADAKARKKEKALPSPKKEVEDELPPPQAWPGPEDGVRKRFEKVLGDLAMPVEEQTGFSLKYVIEGQEEALIGALKLWEEAAEAYKEHRMAKIKGADEEELAEKQQRCLDAAEAMMAIGDVASFKGQPFTEIFAT